MGKTMRFCQQCTALHEVDRFDGDKRSCRDRLNSHNSRRRKKRLPNEAGIGVKAGGGNLTAIQQLLNTQTLASLTANHNTNNSNVLGKLYELLAANNNQAS
eukprot:scaffold474859_cov45-Prasinocladus_malaysianus.AAC.1